MDYNVISNLEGCRIVVENVAQLLYYSHIPTAAVALLAGFFVFTKNSKSLLSRILFFITILFCIWSSLDLFIWLNYDKNTSIMFAWSFFGIVTSLMFIFSFYFMYVYIFKKDISLRGKLMLGLLLLPVIFLTPTRLNLTSFDIVNCVATEGNYFTNYYLFLSLLLFVSIFILTLFGCLRVDKAKRKEMIFAAMGIEFFLFSFLFAIYISSLLANWGLKQYVLEQYGLFGMPIFMAILAYLIVEFGAFDIKLVGVQALVTALVLLVGSQLFFVHDIVSVILTVVTMILSVGFGYALIRSVKKEIEQKETLEAVNKEITERKDQLQKMADSLAIANDKLRKLDNAKTEFISIASHQLRTPITAIKGFVSLILEGSYGEIGAETRGALEKVYLSSERLVALIEDLLNVSRIESGRMTFEFRKASVEKLLKELYDNFILITKKKKFYLDLKLPTQPLPEIMMDYVKIRELVSNFIDNALKYTEKGGVTIYAEIKEAGVVVDENGFVIKGRDAGFGEMLRITVSDTGIGVGRDEIPYLFRKFSRGKDVSRLHVGGTGLGLYVGKAIAEAHHGQAWVESDGVGMGSRFMIEIPVEGVG